MKAVLIWPSPCDPCIGRFTRPQRFAEGAVDLSPVVREAIDADQQGTTLRTRLDARHQPSQHHRQPHDHALCLAPHLIGLHLHQVARLLHQALVHHLRVAPGDLLQPVPRPFISAEGRHHRRDRTIRRQQGHHQHHLFLWLVPPV